MTSVIVNVIMMTALEKQDVVVISLQSFCHVGPLVNDMACEVRIIAYAISVTVYSTTQSVQVKE